MKGILIIILMFSLILFFGCINNTEAHSLQPKNVMKGIEYTLFTNGCEVKCYYLIFDGGNGVTCDWDSRVCEEVSK